MPEITITQSDLSDAEAFLTQFMAEKVPEASFEIGSANRDILIRGFTYLYAYLRGEVNYVTARQSLMRIQSELTDADDISEAVDEILSNFFVSRKDGSASRITVRLHFTQKRAYSIPLGSRFWRTTNLAFAIDSSLDPYVIAENSLFPVFDNRGVLVDYIAEVGMVAVKVGSTYNIPPGTFAKVQVQGGLPYFSYAENTERASSGEDIESSSDLIDRAPTAISVRNLVNNRSIDVTLQEVFPEIKDTLTIGMGEPEMIRDARNEIAKHIQLHVGGHHDTYLDLPLIQVEENGTIGGYFARPDGVINVFRDPQLTHDMGITFSTILGIVPGNILYVATGIVGAPRGFQITSVSDHELEVSENTPFTEASDETGETVTYTVGAYYPSFDDIVPATRTATISADPLYSDIPVGTSRHIQSSGKIILSGKPVQKIVTVELTDPDGAMSLFTDSGTGTVVFYNQTNDLPVQPVSPQYTQYQTVIHNPAKAQSMEQIYEVNVGWFLDPTWADGHNLRVVYMTPQNFSSIHDYVRDREYRVLDSNHLVRVRSPVWIEMVVEYRLKNTATGTVDHTAAAQTVAEFINSFDPNDDLDCSDIATILRTTYSDIGAIYPLEIYYRLYAPDGQMAYFSTTDIVSIFMDTLHPGVTLLNPGDLIPPADLIGRGITAIDTPVAMNDWYNYLGVSDRTVQYRTTESMISFVVKG